MHTSTNYSLAKWLRKVKVSILRLAENHFHFWCGGTALLIPHACHIRAGTLLGTLIMSEESICTGVISITRQGIGTGP